ncbi:MAG: hypothetical protein QMC90_04850, partial [Dehalococcoidales bacterium]|nr:hypothetical protein [Dehalococcoidales bacterium]
MKILSIALLIIGLILVIAGIAGDTASFSMVGGIMMFVGVILLIPVMLRKEEVIDNWSVLIENGQGKAENIFTDTDGFIKESKAPGLRMERQKLAPGIIKGILGVKRDFFVVTPLDNPRLEPFKLFLNARDYGNNLDVSWYVTYKPGPLRLRRLTAAAIVG